MTFPTFISGRGGENSGFFKMILLSLVAHLAVITIILFSLSSTQRNLTFGPIYSVSLVNSNQFLSGSHESSFIEDLEKSGEPTGSFIFKKEVGTLITPPVKKAEVEKLNVEKAIKTIRRKESVPVVPYVKPGGKAIIGARGRTDESRVSSQWGEYVSTVWLMIQNNWTLPPTLVPKENIESVIVVRIARNGKVEFVDFEKPSGNRYFDEAALKAVKKSSPFPPFPSHMMDNYIEIGVRFHSLQLH